LNIIVTGHYGCGGVMAAAWPETGTIDNWLRHVQDVYKRNQQAWSLVDEKRLDRLCELNALEQAINVAETTRRMPGARSAGAVHALVYALHDGILRRLGKGIRGQRYQTHQLLLG
jgi:carbonic anhydrase